MRFGEVAKHERKKSEQVEALESGLEPLVVSCQTAEARGPGQAALHDPTPRQQHKAALGRRVLHDFEPNAPLLSGLLRGRAGIALVHIGQLDRASGDFLDLLGKRGDLRTIALVSRGDLECEQVPERVHRAMDLRAHAPFRAAQPACAPDSGVDCSVRLSITTAVGRPFPPAHARRIERRSWTSSSKQPRHRASAASAGKPRAAAANRSASTARANRFSRSSAAR